MKLNSKQITKYLIQLIILFTVLLFIVIPYTHNLNLIYKNYTTEAKSLELKFKTGEDFEQLRNHYDELNNQIPTYEELLLNQGEELTLIQDLEQIAEKYNLPLTIAKAVTDVIPFEPVKNPRERFC